MWYSIGAAAAAVIISVGATFLILRNYSRGFAQIITSETEPIKAFIEEMKEAIDNPPEAPEGYTDEQIAEYEKQIIEETVFERYPEIRGLIEMSDTARDLYEKDPEILTHIAVKWLPKLEYLWERDGVSMFFPDGGSRGRNISQRRYIRLKRK